MNKISVFTESIKMPYQGISKNAVQKLTEKAVSLAGLDNIRLSIILTDNSYIHRINKEYRNKDSATDVISFANRDEEFPPINGEMEELGDIFISLEKAFEQSHEYGISLDDELRRLIVHGLLHCIGYDHERSKKDTHIMEAREEEILSQF